MPKKIRPSNASVYFSPKGGCTDALVSLINKAKKSIYIQAYVFTSKPLGNALLRAKKRGVAIRVILDRRCSGGNGGLAGEFFENGFYTFLDGEHSIAHDKVMIFDEQKVVTGSFNFSYSAENSNAENLIVLTSKTLAKEYKKHWQEHKLHSTMVCKLSDIPPPPDDMPSIL